MTTIMCSLCRQAVHPESDDTVLQRHTGWAPRRAKGVHALHLRTALSEWAHANCVERARFGIPAAQGNLL